MPPPPEHDPRYESLDAWRGLACLMVVLHHSGFAPGWGEARGDWAGDWAFLEAVEKHFLNPPADRRPHPRTVAGERATVPAEEAAAGLS